MAHVTTMVLKVDLQCHECYKKVNKVLCSFSQIQDRVYDEKQNTMTIKVVCYCDPEKMKQKILCKGKEAVKSIEIKVPKKKEKEDEASKTEDKDKKNAGEASKTEDKDKKDKKNADEASKTEDKDKKNAEETKDKTTTKESTRSPPPQLVPLPFMPCLPVCPVPAAGPFRRTCCWECYEGRVGGPCFHGYNNICGTVPPSSQYGCYWGRPVVCDSYGGGNIYFPAPQEHCSEPAAGCQIV